MVDSASRVKQKRDNYKDEDHEHDSDIFGDGKGSRNKVLIEKVKYAALGLVRVMEPITRDALFKGDALLEGDDPAANIERGSHPA
jgi:hypothetical protein